MTSIARMSRMMKQLFEHDSVELARAAGLRQRKLTFVQLALILVLGWWKQPQAGPSALARFAGSLGVSIEKQGLDCHFTQRTADFLLALLRRAVEYVVCANAVSLPLLQQFRAVLIEDGSSITLPSVLQSVWRGCGGRAASAGTDAKTQAALKVTVRWDLLAGRLQGPYLQEGRQHELNSVLREQVIVPGSLWIADLGYWSLKWLRSLSQSGVFFLMRYKAGIVLWSANQRLDLLVVLPKVVGQRLELRVEVGASKQVRGVRFLAERVPDEVARQRQARIQADADDHGKPVNPLVWELACWTIVLTNVPLCMLSFEQVLALLRARGPVELLFRLWKESGLLDDWQARDPWRILCEVYAKLLAMVVQHWLVLLSCWDDPHRSLSGVAEVLREQVPTLVHGLMKRLPLQQALRLMVARVQANCSIPARTTRLSTSRLLQSAWNPGLT